MLSYFLTVLAVSVVTIALFWLIVIVSYMLYLERTDILFADSTDPDLEEPLERNARLSVEIMDVSNDIKTIMRPIDPTVEVDPDKKPQKPQLIQNGIAENRTVSQYDLRFDIREITDMWLCDGRPLLFALMQIAPVVIATTLLGLLFADSDATKAEFVFTLLECASLSTLVVSLIIGFYSYEPVAENTVKGVYLFGEQRKGFLGAGMQFIVPWLEESEEIPFQTLVWGPQTEEKDDGFHIEGTAGIDTNPATGTFAPLLRGRWPITVIVQVTFHFERSRRRAWWEILNRWADIKELGEQIASAINSVLVTRVRELDIKEEFESPTEAMEALNALQDELPETCGLILQSLVGMREDLPVIIERVMISAVKAGDELQQMLRIQDEAWVKRYTAEKDGQAVQDQLEGLFEIIKEKCPELKNQDLWNAVQSLNEQVVRKLFAELGKESGSFEALARTFLVGKVQDITGHKPT